MQAETGSIKGDTPSLPVIVVLSSQESVLSMSMDSWMLDLFL